MSDDGSSDDWSNDRKAVAYREARNVLDTQQAIITDIDDKAMRTVRLTVILIGVFVTAARINGPAMFHPLLALGGGVFLFLSVVTGVLTYSESDLFLGPNRDYVEQLAANTFTGTTWDDDYLMTVAYWIGENHDDLEWNGKLFLVTQVLLVLGLALVALSIVF